MQLLARPQAVVFDMDGLMLDSERALLGCLEQAAQSHGLVLERSLLLSLIGSPDAVTRQKLADVLGLARTDTLLADSYARYGAIVDAGVPLRPGIIELLELLDQHGIPRAVATATRSPLAQRKLAAAGLLSYFQFVATSTDVAHSKPAPDIYLHAARGLGVDPVHCLALEDSPTGVRAALAAGMTTIQIPDLLEPDEQVRGLGHHITTSLHDVHGLLLPWLSATTA
ncbi:HAD family phosphatase [Stenotrophomonas sp.]|uniref:HAD family hydrolase n=1 Tax=Stenotrophomonas sp. TaxID=69392 RepID=UPI0028ACFF5F|nr:HAD family phosphatase [Stenotrophomonas sp.]